MKDKVLVSLWRQFEIDYSQPQLHFTGRWENRLETHHLKDAVGVHIRYTTGLQKGRILYLFCNGDMRDYNNWTILSPEEGFWEVDTPTEEFFNTFIKAYTEYIVEKVILEEI